jgi:hypothetical protein
MGTSTTRSTALGAGRVSAMGGRRPAEAVAQHLWVALKHEISYLRPPSSMTGSSPK